MQGLSRPVAAQTLGAGEAIAWQGGEKRLRSELREKYGLGPL